MPGPGRRFQKGQSGNPNGRPRVKVDLTRLLAAELQRPVRGTDIPQAEQLVHVVMQRALAGERWAAELVWESIEGKPTQPHTFDLQAEARRLAAEYDIPEARLLDITHRVAQAG